MTTAYWCSKLVRLMSAPFYHDVNDWLSIGADLDLASDITGKSRFEVAIELLGHDVTHVLDLRVEAEPEDHLVWTTAGLRRGNYTNVPIVDQRGYVPPEEWFTGIEAAVSTFWDESAHGDRLYSHCFMGSNRGPSAAMLALLTVEPEMHPFDAFLRLREARPVAGIRYAEAVGMRHLLNTIGPDPDGFWPYEVAEFRKMLADYWTPERRAEHGVHVDRYWAFHS